MTLADKLSHSQGLPQLVLPELGLVCITASDKVRFRALTRKRFLLLGESEQQQILRNLYSDNIRRLELAIEFCLAEGIRLYRLTSKLFPFADESVGATILNEFTQSLQQIGDRATNAGIRLVIHPDQFVVLNSDKPEVIDNSIKILEHHARILDLLQQPRSPWTTVEIHGGKSNQADRLVNTIQALPLAIRSRLALENDEYAYSAAEILAVCQAANIPMVFDAHHHVIHEGLSSYDDESVEQMLFAARTTWAVPEWQLVHISNGDEFFADRSHSDLIDVMPISYRYAPWIEVEAKHKELAIAKLRQEWLATLK
jgi:UV DNA damage endonuclease